MAYIISLTNFILFHLFLRHTFNCLQQFIFVVNAMRFLSFVFCSSKANKQYQTDFLFFQIFSTFNRTIASTFVMFAFIQHYTLQFMTKLIMQNEYLINLSYYSLFHGSLTSRMFFSINLYVYRNPDITSINVLFRPK